MSKWSKAAPSEAGWYWWRKRDRQEPQPVNVAALGMCLRVYVFGNPGAMSFFDHGGEWGDEIRWSGPLSPPAEDGEDVLEQCQSCAGSGIRNPHEDASRQQACGTCRGEGEREVDGEAEFGGALHRMTAENMGQPLPADTAAPAEEATGGERARRVYYQRIVYDVCALLDDRREASKRRIVCGTVGAPTVEVQDALRRVLRKHAAVCTEDCDRVRAIGCADLDTERCIKPHDHPSHPDAPAEEAWKCKRCGSLHWAVIDDHGDEYKYCRDCLKGYPGDDRDAPAEEGTCGCPHCKGLPENNPGDDGECDQDPCFNESAERTGVRCPLRHRPSPAAAEEGTCDLDCGDCDRFGKCPTCEACTVPRDEWDAECPSCGPPAFGRMRPPPSPAAGEPEHAAYRPPPDMEGHCCSCARDNEHGDGTCDDEVCEESVSGHHSRWKRKPDEPEGLPIGDCGICSPSEEDCSVCPKDQPREPEGPSVTERINGVVQDVAALEQRINDLTSEQIDQAGKIGTALGRVVELREEIVVPMGRDLAALAGVVLGLLKYQPGSEDARDTARRIASRDQDSIDPTQGNV